MKIEKKFIFKNFIGKSLLVSIGAFASLWAFTDAFSINVNLFILCAFIIGVSMLFEIILNCRHKNVLVIFLAISVVIFIFAFNKYMQIGLYGMANKIIEQYNDYFNVNVGSFKIEDFSKYIFNSQEAYNTLFACIVALEYVYILSIVTSYKVYPSVHYLFSVTILVLPLVLGLFPGIVPTTLLVYYYIILAMEGKLKSIHFGRITVTTIIFLIFLATILICKPISKYDGEKDNEKYRDVIDKYTAKYNFGIFHKDFGKVLTGKNASGGVSGGKLGEIGKVEYSGETMLKLHMTRNEETVYLKGYVANYYRGSNWYPVISNQSEIYQTYSINNYGYGMNNGVDINKSVTQDYGYIAECFQEIKEPNVMQIEYVNDENKYVYFPYCSDLDYVQSISYMYPYNTKQAILNYNYYNVSYKDALEFMYENQSEYAMYSETSMNIPGEVIEYFSEIIPSDITYDGTKESLEACIKFVRTYLKENTTYSLKPGTLADGEDFVLDFLQNKKKGYCVAYASASTLMFRYMGIPARYVEGYVISGGQQKKADQEDGLIIINVKDSSAHAWTEIYVSGFGFVPVETTPGYYSEGNKKDDIEEESTEETTNAKKENETSKKENETTNKNNTTEKNKNDNIKVNNKEKANKSKYFVLLGIVVIAIIGIGIFARKKQKNQRNIDNYKTSDNRHNIKVLCSIFEKQLIKAKISYGKNISIDKLSADINELLEKIEQIEQAEQDNAEKERKIAVPDKASTIEVLWIIEKAKYSNENVKFSDEEIIKVSKYVEELKNCLQYYKNRL